ncbi:MAG: MBL fold metallo-hydrolase [Clostridia bacterium]|nr:MBL fold metallo-hydrolase [Clostridia bacterium]
MSRLNLCALRSSSKGNSVLISTDNCRILVDCGISGKALEESLSFFGLSPSALDAILITHEHTDHTKGISTISRKHDIPVFATYGTWERLRRSCENLSPQNIRTIGESESFSLGDISVTPFPISHDAAQPVGYTFETADDKVSVATDTGIITDRIFECIKGSRMVLLESNYDLFMLEAGAYPYDLKRRIKSDIGHLSNDDAALTALDLVKSGTREIILGHISPENNYPDLAFQTAKLCLESHGFLVGKDVFLYTANKDSVTFLKSLT